MRPIYLRQAQALGEPGGAASQAEAGRSAGILPCQWCPRRCVQPLGRPGQVLCKEASSHSQLPDLIKDDVVMRIAEETGLSTGQVLFAWSINSGCGVIPKSSNINRLEENLQASQVTLSDAHMAQLDAMEDASGALRYVNIRLHGPNAGPPFRVHGPTLLE